MALSVRDLCEPHESAFAYVVGDQVERLDQVISDSAKDADDFFAKNHITAGLRVLLTEGIARLAGKSGQALFELRQAMGGGKTHSMIALGLLAKSAQLRKTYAATIPHISGFGDARVVAVNGRSIERGRHIWGEIITQLGKAEEGAKFWRDGPVPPTESEWTGLLGDAPLLILLDELPPYIDQATAIGSGDGNLARLAKFALTNLFSAALGLPRCCIVLSSLSGTYQAASNELHDLANEAARQARSLTPVDLATDEIYSILRRRLFAKLPSDDRVKQVTEEFGRAITQAIASQAIPSTARQLKEEIAQTYPFHPSVKHVIALFKNNETFRQTRGLMQIASRMLLSVWRRGANDVALIGCQHLDLSIQEVRDDLNRIRDLQAAVAHDVFDSGQSVTERVNAELGGDWATQISSMLLTASLSSSVDAVQGFTEDQLVEYLISPFAGPREFRDAFQRLKDDAWYLHRNRSDAWYFSPAENLRKLIEDRAKNAPQPKIEADMRRRLAEAFAPQLRHVYQRVEALPKISELDLRGERVCVILPPDTQNPTEALKQFHEAVPEKNNLCVVTGDGSRFADLEAAVRRAYGTELALQQMAHNQPEKAREAQDLHNEAEQAVNATIISLFNKVIYPTMQGLTVAPLQLRPLGQGVRGEEDIAEALSTTGHKKVIRDIDAEAEALIPRAQDLLWPANDRKTRWADVEERARTVARWPWIEPKGLARLREKAKGQGRWREPDAGWIEKGPFPKDKTTVNVYTGNYDDRTGTAQINVRVMHGGRGPQVYYGPTSEVSDKNGTLLPSEIQESDATTLWFVAVDPNGEHETGPATKWTNRLTLTHDVQKLPNGKRRVTLAVRPDVAQRAGGQLKWNTQGINPRDGANYAGEIVVDGAAECKVYAFASHEGVEAERTFVIPAANGEGRSIDYTKPARLTKRLSLNETSASFRVLKAARNLGGRLTVIKMVIGEGDRHVQLKFGSEVELSAELIEQLIIASRMTLRDEQATVAVDIGAIQFDTGQALEDFLKETGEDAKPEEVEQ